MQCVICDVLQYLVVLNYGIRCSKKRKSDTLILKLEAGKPGGSNRSRVSNTSLQVSNRRRGFDGIVLIQAGGFYWRKYCRQNTFTFLYDKWTGQYVPNSITID